MSEKQIPGCIIINMSNDSLIKLYQMIDTQEPNEEVITALYNDIFRRSDDNYTLIQLYECKIRLEAEILERVRKGILEFL